MASRVDRPLGVWEIVTTSLRVYLANANSLLLIVLILMVPATIVITLVVTAALPDQVLDLQSGTANPFEDLSFDDFGSFAATAAVGGILDLIVTMIAIGACFRVVADDLGGGTTDWRRSIAAAFGKIGSLVWIPLLIGLLLFAATAVAGLVIALLALMTDVLVAIGVIALFVGVIYLFVSWSLAIPVLMEEDVRGTNALRRSFELVKGRWWPTFGAYVIAFVLMAIVSAIIGTIFGGNEPVEIDDPLAIAGAAISELIVTPLQAALLGVVFFDLRRRRAAPSSGDGVTPSPLDMPPSPPPPTGT